MVNGEHRQRVIPNRYVSMEGIRVVFSTDGGKDVLRSKGRGARRG